MMNYDPFGEGKVGGQPKQGRNYRSVGPQQRSGYSSTNQVQDSPYGYGN